MTANATLDHLLKIEAQAAAMVKEAQEEADRRIRENEQTNRAAFDEFCKAQNLKRQSGIKKIIEEIKNKYKITLDEYRGEISKIEADTQKFAGLLEEYLGLLCNREKDE